MTNLEMVGIVVAVIGAAVFGYLFYKVEEERNNPPIRYPKYPDYKGGDHL